MKQLMSSVLILAAASWGYAHSDRGLAAHVIGHVSDTVSENTPVSQAATNITNEVSEADADA